MIQLYLLIPYKVYRRDAPATTRGRYREFYQCVCITLLLPNNSHHI